MIGRRAILAAPLALLAGEAQAAVLAATPISRMDTKWWRERHEAKLAELSRVQPGLIWLGDSITENFDRDGPEPWAHYQTVWQHYYAPSHSVNLGFKGDATCHLLWRITHGELDGIAPKAAIILIGANNLGHLHWSAADTLLGIDTILHETRKRLPNTRILLLSVLPSDRTPWASQTTIDINQALAHRYPTASGVTFLDVTGLYETHGVLDHSLYYDPKLTPPEPALHPTAVGMEKLAATIEPVLAPMLRG
jgi:lysophospholipase L1-like esterase